jgi:hypothetical protein
MYGFSSAPLVGICCIFASELERGKETWKTHCTYECLETYRFNVGVGDFTWIPVQPGTLVPDLPDMIVKFDIEKKDNVTNLKI